MDILILMIHVIIISRFRLVKSPRIRTVNKIQVINYKKRNIQL